MNSGDGSEIAGYEGEGKRAIEGVGQCTETCRWAGEVEQEKSRDGLVIRVS